MGLIPDTNVLIHAERQAGDEDLKLDFALWAAYGNVYIGPVTAAELLVGVHRTATGARRIARSAFVQAVLASIPVQDFNLAAARTHAETKAAPFARGETLGANDLLIAATALSAGHTVLTTDVDDFRRMSGLTVVPFDVFA